MYLLSSLLAFFGAIGFLTIYYPNNLVGTKSRQDLPGPKGIPIFGNLHQVYPWRTRIVEWICLMHEKYGDICTFTMPPWGRGIIIGRPEWLLHVKSNDMIKYTRVGPGAEIFEEFPGKNTPIGSDGVDWRRSRKTMAPVFSIKAFTDHVGVAMHKIMGTTTTLLENCSTQDVTVDWNAFFCLSSLSLETDLLGEQPKTLQESDPLRNALTTLSTISSKRLLSPYWKWTEKYTSTGHAFEEARSFVRQMVEDVMSRRQSQNRSCEEDDTTSDYLTILLADPGCNGDLVLIRDTLVTLVFAGRDNTQNVIAWAMNALLNHPDWMAKMREEALRLQSNTDQAKGLPYHNLSQYHVHLAVFYETVRLWPGLPKNGRQVLSDDVLPAIPEAGLPPVKVYKGDCIFWSDYYLMRHPLVWGQDASVFNPGRHLNEDGQFVKPRSPNFNGFGAGPRLCPAAQLSAYEFVACWATILPRFEFIKMYDHEPVMMEAFTACMKGKLDVKIKPYHQ
ncbi:hypothetical protein D9758_001771 [Tetrapyrgos nigripes]|uniref:Cytochrome P450 n=1 Tax=Tetrapyrgos nigripes TaxID=182062 RepID=A0A8H5GX50_9AGAR|nr:hypothetical protein D9758_001771 [Tetrapyrgos nigripes]